MSTKDEDIKSALGSLDPLVILARWLKEALRKKGAKEPWAGVLSTAVKKRVSSRVILLKRFHGGDLFFFSNYSSAKGQDIEKNPHAALNFYWPQLDRQIRTEGVVMKTTRKRSILYWKSRNRSSQLSQWVSKQSQEIGSRQKLEDLKKEAEKRFHKKIIPCPLNWGGYILRVQKIEFWEEREYRLHDRFVFKKTIKGWKGQRLFP